MAHDIGAWLEGLGLGQYADAFGKNEIDLDALPYITEDDLKGIGVALGARRKLLAAIVALTNGEAAEATPAPAPAPDGQAGPALSGERRQVTVLFADLAGFTQLSDELGAEATHAHQFVTRYTEGFSHFVTSMTAPVASGWSDGRVRLVPTGKAPP